MKAWLYRNILKRGWFRLLATVIVVLLGALVVHNLFFFRTGARPTDYTEIEIQRAIESARTMGYRRIEKINCQHPNKCSLSLRGGGGLSLFTSETPRKEVEVYTFEKQCRWAFAFLTGLDDPDAVDSIVSELIAEVDKSNRWASREMNGAALIVSDISTSDDRDADIYCSGGRPLRR